MDPVTGFTERLIQKYIDGFIFLIFAEAGAIPAFLRRSPDLWEEYWWLAVAWDGGALVFGIWAYAYTKRIHAAGETDPKSRSTFKHNSPSGLIAVMLFIIVVGAVVGSLVKR